MKSIAHKCEVCGLVVHERCQSRVSSSSTDNCLPNWQVVHIAYFLILQLKQCCLAPSTIQSAYSAHRQTLTTPVKDSNPSRSSGSPSTALRGLLPPWHSLSLSAFCPPKESPMIPAVVIHCINEVTNRGMLSAGLYRMSMMDECPIPLSAHVVSQRLKVI